MSSAGIVMPAMATFAAIYGGPPLLVLILCLRRGLRARPPGRSPRVHLIGAAVAAVALAFNLAVVLPTLRGLPDGSLRLTGLSLAGLTVSWLCFWAWVVLSTVLRPSRRTAA
ncbi:MAG: hypothetical protein ACOY4T_05080 [Pseudomonadota bacterium]